MSARSLRKRVNNKRKIALSESSDSSSEDSIGEDVKKGDKKGITTLKDVEDDGSSSDSSVENYLKSAHEINLDSSFFTFEKVESVKVEKGGEIIGSLSDSEDESENGEAFAENGEGEVKIEEKAFESLENYQTKLEEAKKAIETYKNRKVKEEKVDIKKLLKVGESRTEAMESSYISGSSDDEMSWDDIENQTAVSQATKEIPKEGVSIIIGPEIVARKKKKDDYLMQVRRRLNRVRKENQVFMHKVHVLCWIAHGNYVNSILNSQNLLAQCLSLIPNENCYPPERADLKYLEQITKWYSKNLHLVEKVSIKIPTISLEQILQVQITKKEAGSKKNYVLIFICILRALGLQCRLVLSLRTLPLRPAQSELCSLSTKDKNQSNKASESTSKDVKGAESSEKSKDPPKIKPETSKKDSSKIKPESSKKDPPNTKNATKSTAKPLKEKQEESKNPSHQKESRSRRSIKPVNYGDEKSEKSPQKRDTKTGKETSSKEKETSKNDKKPSKAKLEEAKNPSQKELRSRRSIKPVNYDEKFDKPPEKRDTKTGKETSDTKSRRSKSSKPDERQSSKRSLKVEDTRRSKSASSKSLDLYSSDDDFKPDRRSLNSSLTNLSPRNDVRNDIINILKGDMLSRKQVNRSKLVRRRNDDNSDSDYMPEPEKKAKSDSADEFKEKKASKGGVKVKQRVKPKSALEKESKKKGKVVKDGIDRRVLSSDDEDGTGIKEKEKVGNDVWCEVFLEAEEKWISVDVIKGQVHCVSELHSRASTPMTYVLAWNNNLSIKDVTSRYCPHMNTITRKLRVDSDWWNNSLKPFLGRKTARDKEEDEDLARQQLEQPLPKTIMEYKNHPLYALKRHLLKFEAIYPPDAVTLGFVRNEPVYARECVHTLHSREIWIKHAKVVKPGEQPYKIVKARPKYDKLSGQMITDKPLEIFGPWQVDDYIPPCAENGVVPRNAFGNVELFKACMLPGGTVHLQLPGLNKVCRKLQIDCASALVGFDYHSGGSHPVYDGFVVCEEFKDKLIQAWEEEQEEIVRREREKIEKRVYDNWKKLIKGLLIREKLKNKYGFETASGSGKNKKKSKGPRFVAKKRRVVSDSESSS